VDLEGVEVIRKVPKAEVEADTEPVYLLCVALDDPDYVSPFDDNLTVECNGCGTLVVHRPTAPRNSIPICLRCAEIQVVEEKAKGNPIESLITEEAFDEANAELAKKGKKLVLPS
jgi:hypothetical protein